MVVDSRGFAERVRTNVLAASDCDEIQLRFGRMWSPSLTPLTSSHEHVQYLGVLAGLRTS